jgi:twitching motility protein PilJ
MAWTMRTKLYAGFGIVLFIMAVIGLVNWQNTRSIVAASTRLYDNGEMRSAVTLAAAKSARTQMILLVVAVIAGGGVATLLTSNIGRQVRSIMDTCNQINKADYTARVEVVSKDELGAMATSLNTVLDHTLTLMLQSQQERDSMQASIMKLLEEVTDVAEGDLTLEAEVTEDATGVIADSFNYMIQQLRGVVARVQETTLQVSASANEVQATAEHLAQGSTVQATQIVESSAAIDEMTESIQQVSEHATLSATVAEQALANARQGTAAVQNTLTLPYRDFSKYGC